jgi:Cu(I)/Ag(I) efflux system protein CusF
MKHHHLLAALGAATCVCVMSLALPLPSARAQSASNVRGQIIGVDQSAGEITIRHGPIKTLGMDHGMTMVFRAKDPQMLKRVEAGDRIKFDAQDQNGEYSVSRIEKIK